MNRIDLFKKHLAERRAVKIISGIDNFDKERVRNVVSAAEIGGASAVDICFDREIISMVKNMTSLPVFVSSVNPKELYEAAKLGADALEIGNFDAMYKKGERITAENVLEIARETKRLLCNMETFLCVTVPGHIDISEQIALALKLEEMNIDLIQTEGAASNTPSASGARGLMQLAEVSISNTMELARNVSIPVMTASGLTASTVPLAFAAGASAIGAGSCVNRLNSVIAMAASVKSLTEAASEAANRNKISSLEFANA